MADFHERDRALLRWIRNANTFDLHLAYTRCKRDWVCIAIGREIQRRRT